MPSQLSLSITLRITLRAVQIWTDFHKPLFGVPEGASYGKDKLEPHHTWTEQLMWSHTPTALHVGARTVGGKELSSEKVNVASRDVVFALVSSDGITLQRERWNSFLRAYGDASNQTMKPTRPSQENLSEIAMTPCRGLSHCR